MADLGVHGPLPLSSPRGYTTLPPSCLIQTQFSYYFPALVSCLNQTGMCSITWKLQTLVSHGTHYKTPGCLKEEKVLFLSSGVQQSGCCCGGALQRVPFLGLQTPTLLPCPPSAGRRECLRENTLLSALILDPGPHPSSNCLPTAPSHWRVRLSNRNLKVRKSSS